MTEKDDGVTIYDEFGHGPEADLRRHLWLKQGRPEVKKPASKPLTASKKEEINQTPEKGE